MSTRIKTFDLVPQNFLLALTTEPEAQITLSLYKIIYLLRILLM